MADFFYFYVIDRQFGFLAQSILFFGPFEENISHNL